MKNFRAISALAAFFLFHSLAQAEMVLPSCASTVSRYESILEESLEERCDRFLEDFRKDDKPVYLLVEGASGFSKKYMAAMQSGLNETCVSESIQKESLSPQQTASITQALKVLGGQRQNISRPYLLMATHEVLQSKGVAWTYFRQAHGPAAMTCAKRIADASGDHSRLRIIGYSMGGYVALKIANELEKEGRPVQKGLTVDPVGRGVRSFPSLVSDSDSQHMPIPLMTVWWNLFQKSDTRSLGIGVKGNSLPWANQNISAPVPEMDLNKDKGGAKRGHRTLFSTDTFKALLEDFMIENQ